MLIRQGLAVLILSLVFRFCPNSEVFLLRNPMGFFGRNGLTLFGGGVTPFLLSSLGTPQHFGGLGFPFWVEPQLFLVFFRFTVVSFLLALVFAPGFERFPPLRSWGGAPLDNVPLLFGPWALLLGLAFFYPSLFFIFSFLRCLKTPSPPVVVFLLGPLLSPPSGLSFAFGHP